MAWKVDNKTTESKVELDCICSDKCALIISPNAKHLKGKAFLHLADLVLW